MDCPYCGHPNRAGSRFCGECAAPLGETVACPRCGEPNPPGQRHCNQCAAELADRPATAPAGTDATATQTPSLVSDRGPEALLPGHLAERIRGDAGSLQGERKQVTVMFADVMGSMDLAERTDPEHWRGIMDRFVTILSEGVHRFEGTVDKFTGDGIMALFGAPIAHEDHAQRACYAALHLTDRLAEYAGELRRTEGLSFSVRIGLNSGEVVVGSVGEDLSLDYTAVGHTVGLAQRMESLAEPGKTYLAPTTARLVEGYLELSDLGEFEVRGVSEPVRVHELSGAGAARGRLDISRARGLSRFVGRGDEMEVLEKALAEARGGRGGVVGVVGEAGVGKSRLCHEFAERCRAKSIPVYTATGRAHTSSVPLLPVLELLRDYFGIEEQDSDRTARERIAGRLLLLDEAFREDLPLMFDFLGVPDPGTPAPQMSAEARQRRLLAMFKHLIQASSEREPGVNLAEDLHWFDPGTEFFLANMIDSIPGTRSFAVLNFRPEYRADWMGRAHYRQIALEPLGPEAADELLAELLGADPSLDGAAELIRERSGGNPFFIEEIVQALVEGGQLEGERGSYRLGKPLDEAALPATVQALLASRIDRLSERDKLVLQAAAVIGKELSAPLLAEVVALPEEELEGALRELIATEFVFEQALYPVTEYAFKHPLTQEVAYGSQLTERRAATHAAVAGAIERLEPERLDEQAALIAEHWESAGEALQAARWNARAAAWAGFSHPGESVRYWRRAMELAAEAPASDETAALGLVSRMNVLQFGWRLGISAEEAETLFEQGRELAEAAGDDKLLASLLGTYSTLAGLGGDIPRYVELATESLGLAEASGDRALQVVVVPSAIYSLYLAGRYREALETAERAIDLCEGEPTLGAGVTIGNPYAWCLHYRGFLLNVFGRLEEGARELSRALEVAREQGDLETAGWAHLQHVNLAAYRGDPDGGLSHALQELEIAERIGDSFSRGWAYTYVGYAHLLREEWGEAAPALERGLEIVRESRTGLEAEALRMALIARALGVSDYERARELGREAVELARRQGARASEINALRLLASLLLVCGGPDDADEAETALEAGLKLARESGARGDEAQLLVLAVELPRVRGDGAGVERALREARELCAEIGATGHLERLEQELAALSA